MEAFRVETKLTEDGTLTLEHLPFHAGESVEILIVSRSDSSTQSGGNRYSLRGTPFTYHDPTSPVGEADWETIQ